MTVIEEAESMLKGILKKVLIVDDEELIRELLKKTLLREGLGVVTAQSAIEANQVLSRCHVDCVVLDMKMPQVHGCAVYEAIRRLHKGTKVIVSSVYGIDEQKQVMAEAQGYFDKSEGIHKFLELVRQVLYGKEDNKEVERSAAEGGAAYRNGDEIERENKWMCN